MQAVIITHISSGKTRYRHTQASNKDKKAVYLHSKRVLTKGLITTPKGNKSASERKQMGK